MRGLKGCTEGQSGPVRVICRNGALLDEPTIESAESKLDRFAELLTREQELAEQDYTQ